MHAAQVLVWGSAPVCTTVPDLPPPSSGQLRLKILGAAVHRLVRARAAGQHFSAKTVPLDPGADAVGLDEATGDIYYIPPFAVPTFAEYANVDKDRLAKLPAGSDPIAIAALINPIMSSWMALKECATDLPRGYSVLILGVTGISGRTAVGVAKALGAGRIVGVARNEEVMKSMDGLDSYVVLKGAAEETDFSNIGHIDVVLDYVWGKAAVTLLSALKTERVTQFVNIGSVGGDETINLPAQLLRSKTLRLSGSAPGAWSMAALGREMPSLVQTAALMERSSGIVEVPLADVEKAWSSEEAKKKRLVLVP